jgi:hypothetical protein
MSLFTKTSGSGRLRAAVSVFCVLLVMFAGVVQVTHTHLDRTPNHANCSLCVAAHLALGVAHSPVPTPAASMAGAVELAFIRSGIRSLSVFALFTRPPPVAAATA